jgi:CheY-like chemotaxis protein
MTLGASDYLSKPIDAGQLTATLRKYEGVLAAGSVLVVDDEESNRDLLRRLLEREGWQVAEAANGREALDTVGQSVPALIMLDLMMPEMDGFEFLQVLRGSEAWRHIPVIVLTAMCLTPEQRHELEAKVYRVIPKAATAGPDWIAQISEMVYDCVAHGGVSESPATPMDMVVGQ